MKNTLTREALLNERKNLLIQSYKSRKYFISAGVGFILAPIATIIWMFNFLSERDNQVIFLLTLCTVMLSVVSLMGVRLMVIGIKYIQAAKDLEKNGLSDEYLKSWRESLEEAQKQTDKQSAMLELLKQES